MALSSESRPTASGWCVRCGVAHSLAQGPARETAVALMQELETRRRVDLGADNPDPRFATAYLDGPARGQMFGVLDGVDAQGEVVTLRAFSSQYNGVWRIDDWVPPVFEVEAYGRLMDPGDRKIKDLGRRLEDAEPDSREHAKLKQQRKAISQSLMKDLHGLYTLRNFRGETRSLAEFFPHGIPTGAGDCCAPKLLQEASRQGLKPLGLAEFYWGRTNASQTRTHGQFYANCSDKCGPILGFMLCGVAP